MKTHISMFMVLCTSMTTYANTMSGALMGSQHPPVFDAAATVDLGGGFASTGCTVDPATGDFSCTGDLTFSGYDLITPLTGGADGILLKPAGTTAFTVLEGGNATLVGDLTITGNDITLLNINSAATGGSDNILFKPAGTTAFTVAEGGNATLVGDLVLTGGNIQAASIDSALSGGADDITINPAGTLAVTIAEGGDVTVVGDLVVTGADITAKILKTPITGGADNMDFYTGGVTSMTLEEAGGIQVSKVVTVHSACAASGDRGKIDVFSVGDTVSFCGCRQSAAGVYSWVALHGDGVCS